MHINKKRSFLSKAKLRAQQVLKNPSLHCVSWSSPHTPNCKETGGGSTGLHVFVKIANFFHWTCSAMQCETKYNFQ
jgi:hypothetical protein